MAPYSKNPLSKSKNSNPHQIWIYGKHPVLLALARRRRKIYQVFLSQNQSDLLAQIIVGDNKSDKAAGLIKIVDNHYISSLLPPGSLHQGLAALVSPLPLSDEKQFFDDLDTNHLPPLLILDQLTDPHNIGAIIRSAIAFNVKNIVVTKHNFPAENSVISKSSAGMIELANLIMATNLNNFLAKIKKFGYWSVGLSAQGDKLINQLKDYKPIALIIGNEGKGIRPLLEKNCDLLAKIAISSQVESLNVSNAAAIALYELGQN